MSSPVNNTRRLKVALAGQANVGKSVIFNYFTGLHQHIGNWPGKTIEKKEGFLFYKNHYFDILDLPGIYSLSTYSLEEHVAREYIINHQPDFIINVIDATNLERNLIFTLQLLETGVPIVLAVNMMDIAKKRKIEINLDKLQQFLGLPVVATTASRGHGLSQLLDVGMSLVNSSAFKSKKNVYGQEVETRLDKIIHLLNGFKTPYNKRFLAVKFLEKDKKISKKIPASILKEVKIYQQELEIIHGHDSSLVIADERCHLASRIAGAVVKISPVKQFSWSERIDSLTTHKIWGYPFMLVVFWAIFFAIFKFGDWFSAWLEYPFNYLINILTNFLGQSLPAVIIFAAIRSVLALTQLALPYILPFYLILNLLEDWGYLARVAFLSDNLMHKLGVHGKAAIPLLLGFGCNVPACLSCRIMETQRERFITALLTVFVPCSAVTIIIMGLVGKFVGIYWAFLLYLLDFIVILILGKVLSKIMPGEATELIMEMPDYKRPAWRTIIFLTWLRLKKFIFIAAPFIIVFGMLTELIYALGWLPFLNHFLSPLTVNWLGLPLITGSLLIFGIFKKELILIMLAALVGTTNFIQVMTPVQMITLGVVSMFYIPCIATIAVLWKEFGWRRALIITGFKIIFALILGGLIYRLLNLVL